MAKVKASVTKKTKVPASKPLTKSLRGCLVVVVIVLIAAVLASGSKPKGEATATSRPDVRPTSTDVQAVAVQATDTVSLVTIIPTVVVNRSGLVTMTPGAGTAYPTATVTDTPTDAPTQPPATATTAVQAINSETYYVTRDSNVRTCPSTDCNSLGTINKGSSVVVTGSIDGKEVTAGNALWYQVQYGGQAAYVYSPALTKNAPVQIVAPTAIPQQSSPVIVPPVLSNSGVTCPDINATCDQLASCDLAKACYAAGNKSLDKGGIPGLPCEQWCKS